MPSGESRRLSTAATPRAPRPSAGITSAIMAKEEVFEMAKPRKKKPVPRAPRTIEGSAATATRQTFEERQRKAIKAIAAKWAKQPRQRGL